MQPAESASDARAATSTSRSLLARLHANDPDAWRRLVSLYTPLVWHWCRNLNLPKQDVADIYQDVFQAVAANIASFHKDKPGDTFRGWLRTITKNKVLDHFRRQQRQPRGVGGSEAKVMLAQVPETWDDEAVADNRVVQDLFHRALELIQGDFEERTWRAFWLIVVESREPADVARELAMSPGAVRVAKCRVLQRLRQELGDLPA